MPPTLYAGVKFILKKSDLLSSEQTTNLLDLLNKEFRKSLACPFTIKSEEVEGFLVIQDTWRFPEIIQLITLEFNVACPRYALGIGNLTTNFDPEENIDGPLLKTMNKALKMASTGERDVAVRLPSPFLTRLINTLFSIESDLRNDWSEAHREAIKLAKQGLTQVEIAQALGVTQAAISQRLKHARWERYLEVTKTIQELLTQVRWKTLLPWDIRKERKKRKKQRA